MELADISMELISKVNNKIDNFEKTKDIPSILTFSSDVQAESPYISYFIPTFCRIEALKKAIESILNQEKCYDYEILIVDDSAVLDDSNPTLKFLREQNYPYINYYINKKNLRQAGNWNRGFILAKGKYLSMIHDDDYLYCDYSYKIKKVLSKLEKKNINFGVIMPKFNRFFEKDGYPVEYPNKKASIREEKYLNMLLRGLGVTISPSFGSLFNPKAVIDIGGFNEDFFPCFDYMVGYKLLANGYKCYVSSNILGHYRIGINELLKKENIQKSYKIDYYFREVLYSKNKYTKLFAKCFKDVQMYISMKILKGFANENGLMLTYEDLDFNGEYKNVPVKFQIYRVLKMIVKICTGNKYRY